MSFLDTPLVVCEGLVRRRQGGRSRGAIVRVVLQQSFSNRNPNFVNQLQKREREREIYIYIYVCIYLHM